MGSSLDKPAELRFEISISDPDAAKPKDNITKIDIVTDGGKVAETYTPAPANYTVTWSPTIHDSDSKYCVRI
jgi:hypothetical protein